MTQLVSLEDTKTYLSIETDEEDDLLISLVRLASTLVCNYTGKRFVPCQMQEKLDGGMQELCATHCPLFDVTRIFDTFSGTDIALVDCYIDHDRGFIYRHDDASWPKGCRRYTIEYEAGYKKTPGDIQLATLMIIADLKCNRTAGVQEETIGDYSYKRLGNLAPRVRQILDRYTEMSF